MSAAEFTVRQSDNGDCQFVKLAFKDDTKWTSFFLPDWGWKKFASMIPDISKYINNRASTTKPMDISKRYHVGDELSPV
jgi:hypothetical protein